MLFKKKCLLNYSQRLHRLRIYAVSFLLLLLIPLCSLLYFSYQQSENNLLIEYEQEALNLTRVTNRKLFRKLTLSNQIPTDAFNYYRYVHNPLTKKTQQVLSPLAQLNEKPLIHGLVGYFQVNSQGTFNSPIWPYPISDIDIGKVTDNANNIELITRQQTAHSIYEALFKSDSIKNMINKGLDLDNKLFDIIFDLPEHLIFYRVVSVANTPTLQGYLVKRAPYLYQQIAEILELRSFDIPILVTLKELDHSNNKYFLYTSVPGNEPQIYQPAHAEEKYQQQTIFEAPLQWPYRNYTLSLSSTALPLPPSAIYSSIFNVVLTIIILSACYGFYNLSVKQLALGEQRLNFISSVSHELKTPITSIKMYSEMLKSGAVASEKYKEEYYEFISSESERLARLINNILQLSSLGRYQQSIKPEYTQLSILQDIIRSKTSSLIEKHNFQQHIVSELAHPEETLALVDADAFTQIVINITDNAIKFFEPAGINDDSRKKIDFIFRKHPMLKNMVQLEIRDYGKGITKEQEDKVFELFYRGGNELTRNTKGTGIGLALVHELVSAQQGEIQVQRRYPGLAMLISLPAKVIDHASFEE